MVSHVHLDRNRVIILNKCVIHIHNVKGYNTLYVVSGSRLYLYCIFLCLCNRICIIEFFKINYFNICVMIITHLTNTKLSEHKPVSILMYNFCYNPKIVIYNTYSLPSWTNTLYIITSCFLIYFSVINNITKKNLGEVRVYFTWPLTVHHLGKSGLELK